MGYPAYLAEKLEVGKVIAVNNGSFHPDSLTRSATWTIQTRKMHLNYQEGCIVPGPKETQKAYRRGLFRKTTVCS